MLPISLVRRGSLVGMVSGVLWIIVGLSIILFHATYLAPVTIYDYLVSALYSLALFGLVGTMLGLQALQAKRTKEPGVFVLLVVCIAAILTGAGNIAQGLLHIASAGSWVYYPSSAILLFGLFLFGIVTLVAGILPPWYSWAIVLSLLGQLLASIGGGILFGIVWFMFAYFLWSGRTTRSLLPERSGRR